jgi:hypothetical protein
MKTPGIPARHARWRLAAISCGVMLLTVACGSGSSSTAASAPSSSAPASASASGSPASSALCADAAALRAALAKLTQVKVGKGAVNEIKGDLAGVQTAATSFANDAKGQFQAQTSSLKSALASLGTAVQKLAANPSTSAVASVATALGQVTAAAQHLFAAVGKRCPSAG